MSRSNDSDLQLFVDRLTARSVLDAEERQAILALRTHRLDLKARHDFVHENEESSYCCLIVAGLVGRFGQLNSGVRQITAFHIPGDMADLHSVVRPIGIGGLHALTDATILRVPHDAIRAMAARYPAIAEALWRDCMLDAAILMQWVVNVGRRDARTRLAHIFCEMAIRYGENRDVLTEYAFPVTQEQLGEAAALTGVHVNRSLKMLRESGLVTTSRGIVQIHDWQRLVKVGEFDPAYLIADTHPERQRRRFGAD